MHQHTTKNALRSLPEVGRTLGISVDTVRRLVRNGQLEAGRVGGQLRVAPAEINRYLVEIAGISGGLAAVEGRL